MNQLLSDRVPAVGLVASDAREDAGLAHLSPKSFHLGLYFRSALCYNRNVSNIRTTRF
jgi:hypothetical protein